MSSNAPVPKGPGLEETRRDEKRREKQQETKRDEKRRKMIEKDEKGRKIFKRTTKGENQILNYNENLKNYL